MSDSPTPTLRNARPSDWEAVHQLLTDSDLPVDDLGPDKLDAFMVADDAGEITGLIGVEVFGETALLRSLVVAGSARRSGIGTCLVNALESAAQAAEVRSLWLLTIDAEQFFGRHGYAMVERDRVPDSIRQTSEFSDLCPGTAHLMMKDLTI